MANQTPLVPRPEADPRREHDANPGQKHSDDLFRHFEDQYSNPTGSSVGEDANIDRAKAGLRDGLAKAESQAAAGAAGGSRGSRTALANRENGPNYYYKPRLGQSRQQAKDLIKDAKLKAQQRGGPSKRGLLIGLGSGGGLLAVVAGFSSLLPFKLPGIMDTLVNDTGKRIEHVVEVRAERILFQYILRGSTIALNNGNVIATGNPIGDLFANIRTSSFESDLRRNTGLEFKPGPNKTVKLVHNGADLGNVKNTEDILKILAKGEQGKSLTRADIRKIIRTQIPTWRFWKRAKFLNWLRIKYNVPRWGTREQQEGEKDEDYEKAVKKEHVQRVQSSSIQNLGNFVDCAIEDKNCLDKTDQGDKMLEQVNNAANEATNEVIEKGADKSTETIMKAIVTKLTTSSVGAYVPYVGWVDVGVRLLHKVGEIIDDDLLQKLHAKFLKQSSGALAVAYAGYSDQTKAGDLGNSAIAMFSNNFDGWEDSAAYSVIQTSVVGGPVTGVMLEPMERAQEAISLPEFAEFGKTMFGTVGWVGRWPSELWFRTVSQVFDLASNIVGDSISWLSKFTPADELMKQFAPVMAEFFTGVLKFVGMSADPLEIGARLVLFIHQGLSGSFNDKAKEDGMRKLTESQALEMDNTARIEEQQYLATLSPYERLLSLDNPDSLVTRVATTVPSSITTNPLGTLASSSLRLVAAAPQSLARATAGTAYAADAPQTTESLYGLNTYGGLSNDLSAELDTSVKDAAKKCPENSDNSFNHCKIDRDTVEAMKCVFVKCADMYEQVAANDPLFSYGAEGPLYGPDAVQPPAPRYAFSLKNWATTSGTLLAGLLPIGALELSRRRF